MLDEETGAEPRAVSASIADPYLLIIRDDSSLFVAQMDSNNELEDIERADQTLTSTKWLSGCLYSDVSGVFAEEVSGKGKPAQSVLAFLLSNSGALYVSCIVLLLFRHDETLTLSRHIGFLTSRNQSSLLRDCPTFRPCSLSTSQQGRVRQKRP
jgi:hypothetical protein